MRWWQWCAACWSVAAGICCAPVAADEKGPTGSDYLEMSHATRLAVLERYAVVMVRNGVGDSAQRLAPKLKDCLDEALTVRNREERLVVEAYKNNTLTELAIMCGIIISADSKARR